MCDSGIIFLRRSYLIDWYQLLHPNIAGSMWFRFSGPTCIVWACDVWCSVFKLLRCPANHHHLVSDLWPLPTPWLRVHCLRYGINHRVICRKTIRCGAPRCETITCEVLQVTSSREQQKHLHGRDFIAKHVPLSCRSTPLNLISKEYDSKLRINNW